jgi:hypothetical protein
VKNRTSGAKAAPAQYMHGTAEAVPFVQSVFPQPVKSYPDTKHEFFRSLQSPAFCWTSTARPPHFVL